MCWHGGPMKLDEYRQEVKDIYELSLEMFKTSQKDEVYEAILEFRDDEDLIGWGIWNKVFKSFDSVKKYILKQREFMDEEDEEPMVNRAYWSVTKYKLNKGEYEELMICCFSIDMQLLSVDFGLYIRDFFQDNKTYDEISNHNYLLMKPQNIELPYQTGDILKINAMPFGKDFYVVYGGEACKGDFEQGIVEKFDNFYHWCIYEFDPSILINTYISLNSENVNDEYNWKWIHVIDEEELNKSELFEVFPICKQESRNLPF